MENDRVWHELDSDLAGILSTTLQGPVEKKLKAFTTIIYNVSKEKFGAEGKKNPVQNPQGTRNRREREMRRCRAELKDLTRVFRRAPECEKD